MSDPGSSFSRDLQSSFLEERRTKPRLECSYPTTVKGLSSGGTRYQTRAVLANISANGMYLRTKHQMRDGELLSVVVRLSQSIIDRSNQFRLSATCQVVRVESKPDGTYGVAMRIQRHRYL